MGVKRQKMNEWKWYGRMLVIRFCLSLPHSYSDECWSLCCCVRVKWRICSVFRPGPELVDGLLFNGNRLKRLNESPVLPTHRR